MKCLRIPLLSNAHKESRQIDKDMLKRAQLVLLEYDEYNPITHLQKTLNISWTKASELYRTILEERDKIAAAAKELRRFQDWRTGKDIRSLDAAGLEVTKITSSINTILSYFGFPHPFTDCSTCAYNSENIEEPTYIGCQMTARNKRCNYKEISDNE